MEKYGSSDSMVYMCLRSTHASSRYAFARVNASSGIRIHDSHSVHTCVRARIYLHVRTEIQGGSESRYESKRSPVREMPRDVTIIMHSRVGHTIRITGVIIRRAHRYYFSGNNREEPRAYLSTCSRAREADDE